jgi:DNA-binding transcriptional ArsR family regulator
MGVTALDAAPVFDALGDPNRLRIVIWLCEHGPCSTSTVTQAIPATRQAAAKHLLQLESARLVTSAKRGRERIWTVQPKSLTAAGDYLGGLSRQWDRRIDRLRALVEDGST